MWVCLGHSSCPAPVDSNKDGEAGKEVTSPQALILQCPRGSAWDMFGGHVHTTKKVTIPLFGTVSIHGNISVQGHCNWVHMLAEPALGPQLPASMVPTPTYGKLHPESY